MRTFVNRETELKFLNDEYSRTGSSLIILYGRRRIGKTELCRAFMKSKNALYFLATEENEIQNRNAFKDVVSVFCKNELLKNSTVNNWNILFETILEKYKNKKILLIIDEFQYLGKCNPAFPSIFQKIWDTILKDNNIMVILCGSLISMMEEQTLNYSSPLYGRRTGQIKLKQIKFKYYNKFFVKKEYSELIKYYAITGGVPKYIELFHDCDDVYSSIYKNIMSKESFLYDEPNFLLRKEVSEVGSYFSIIKAIAAGNQKLSKIAGVLEMKQTGITKYLKTLIDLDIIEREVPITEENPEKSKKGLYKIKDNFILFWFKFIYPNISFIESDNTDIVMNKIKEHFIDNHVSYVYEDICIEKMWELNSARVFGFNFNRIGRWWNNTKEIDIVALDTIENNIIFGECKFWENKVGINILAALKEKSNYVEWNKNNRKEQFILFSINGFTDDLIKLANERNDIFLFEKTLINGNK